jgi:hypothetical protein
MAALIPLEELMDPPVRQRYDMPEDPEVFDTLSAVARQKEVRAAVQRLQLRLDGERATDDPVVVVVVAARVHPCWTNSCAW